MPIALVVAKKSKEAASLLADMTMFYYLYCFAVVTLIGGAVQMLTDGSWSLVLGIAFTFVGGVLGGIFGVWCSNNMTWD